MPETADPVAALQAKDVPARAAGARDLGATGGPEHVPALLAHATGDKSPGVRLAAAAAAADILSRYRLPPRFAEIPLEDREAHLRALGSIDPQLNTGLFQVCGTLGIPAALSRIAGGLRDPRVDVRNGAVVGLWRYCASAAVNGDTDVEAQVVRLLDDPRVRTDTRAEIARVCANVGFTSALDAARAVAADTIRAVQKVAEEAVARLELPPVAAGLWVDRGLDAGALDPSARPRAWMAALSDSEAVFAGDGEPSRGALPRPLRHLRLRPPGGSDAAHALQTGLRTWFPADDADVIHLGDLLVAAGRHDLLDAIDPFLPATAAGLRVRGAALLARADAEGALHALEDAVAMKKAPVDASWYLADALHRLGRDAEARPHLERYVAKAPKKAPFIEEAKRRLAG